jgi:phenylacetate-coenzyme A ligase PaaK-like adenylate-forming protein
MELQNLLQGVKAFREPSLEYQVVKPDGGPAPLTVRVEVATSDEAVQRAAVDEATDRIRQELGVEASVEILARETIPRAGYKATRVVDD